MMRLDSEMRLTDNPFFHFSNTGGHRQLHQQPSSFSCPTHLMAVPRPLCHSPTSPLLSNLNTNIQTDTRTQVCRCNPLTNQTTLPTTSETQSTYLQTLLESGRPFLRGELEKTDVNLPSLIAVLKSVGAGECWHKHGSFLDHLVDTYRILKLWGAPDAVCLCGLFHSAYSNSYLSLAIFDPSTGRDTIRTHVGDMAEQLIHLFCIIPRQQLVHDDLLFHYPDESELLQHLIDSEKSLTNARKGVFEARDEEWRKKLKLVLPADGIVLKHIKTGEDVHLSTKIVATFLLITMADFSDQFFGFQDVLFDNSDGTMQFSGNDYAIGLWPGDGKPGLWMNSISRMGAIYTLIMREEQMCTIEQSQSANINSQDKEIKLVTPPVFDNCTKVLSAKDHIEARDWYWEGVCNASKKGLDWCEEVLKRSVEKNPFVAEPHVVLGQIYLSQGRFEEAQKESEEGLRLLLEWGSPWDKRMLWEGWVAWCRVLVMKSKEKSWPDTSWGILNLGLVR
ncbi:Tetratricopeptide-like helical [Artemisia annua]|uniref:Tetratricopeptide-like helical n=1 Tax=Artemisia annua TaxID=35608 RepID=A0A2U1Q1A2_ARTAN|nr:Tetratricopeptide-like helical [Artemisia annua]